MTCSRMFRRNPDRPGQNLSAKNPCQSLDRGEKMVATYNRSGATSRVLCAFPRARQTWMVDEGGDCFVVSAFQEGGGGGVVRFCSGVEICEILHQRD